MKDNFGDKMKVEVEREFVLITFTERHGLGSPREVVMELGSEGARKFAKKVKKAADSAARG